VQRGDRGLDDVGPAAAQGQRAVEQRAPLRDPLGVPQGAVLILEQHQLALAEARLAA
jgi:hypothetical protein